MSTKRACYKCGATDGLANYDLYNERFQCARCSSVPRKGTAVGAVPIKVSADWNQRALESHRHLSAKYAGKYSVVRNY